MKSVEDLPIDANLSVLQNQALPLDRFINCLNVKAYSQNEHFCSLYLGYAMMYLTYDSMTVCKGVESKMSLMQDIVFKNVITYTIDYNSLKDLTCNKRQRNRAVRRNICLLFPWFENWQYDCRCP